MKYKTYVIEDKEFNAVDLGKELGVTQQTARNRLKVAKTINELYKPLYSTIYKTHIIEGELFTSRSLAKLLGCAESTARARLGRHRTLKGLLEPIQSTEEEKTGKVIEFEGNSKEARMCKLAMRAW
jgi:predicted transcriptional regulator